MDNTEYVKISNPSQGQVMLDNESIDVRRIVSLFISNWYWFAISLLLALILSYGMNRYSPKVYTVASTLLIKDDMNGGIGGIATSVIPGGDIFRNQQNLKNEMEILKSFSLNKKVMEKLEDFHVQYMGVGRRGIVESVLYKDCPFIVKYDSLKNQNKGVKVGITILNENEYNIELNGGKKIKRTVKFGERFSESGFDFILHKRYDNKPLFSKEESNIYYFVFKDPASLANEYRAKLVVAPRDKDASLVTLTVSGFVPRQESDYLNMLMDVYIFDGLEYKKQIAEKTIEFINEQLNVVSDSLEVAAKKLESFRMANSFIDLKNEVNSIQTKVDKAKQEKAMYNLQLQYYNYLSQYLEERNSNGAIISPTIIGITDQLLISLVGELTNLQRKKEEMGLNIGDNQPAIELINQQMASTQSALKESVKNCIAALNLSLALAEEDIASGVEEINTLPSTEKTFISIQRQFDLNNTIYTYLLEKRAESGIAKASTLPDNRPIDYAQLRGQIKPKERKNYLIAIALGLLIPAVIIALIDFLNDKVIDKKDLLRKTKVPIIGFISHSDSKNEIVVVEKPGSALSESFRSVRTALKYYVKENEVCVIAISSAISSEGKTFISVNLASIIAMLGKKVLLIGLDLRKPRINRILEYEKSPGMSSYLSGNCEYEEIIKKTQVENLFYTPSGPVPPNPAELIEKDRMTIFMERARKEFDYIIFDTPPVAIVTDAILLSKFADINLFVVRQRYSSINTLELVEQLRLNGEVRNMAIVLNDISLSGYYGYGLRYGYLYSYGYSYGNAYYAGSYYGKYAQTYKSGDYYKED